MVITKARITGFLMASVLTLTVPFVYADSGNGGNLSGGQTQAVAGQSSSGQADHAWRHWGHHKGGGFFRDLTDDQKKQLKDIWQKQREAGKTAFEQIKADRDGITNELLQTTPDVNKINDFKSKLEALGAQMMDNRINSDLEVKKILTPEQFAEYLEFQKHKAGRFHKKGGRCEHHHGDEDND